jgi:hypothetical protein
MLGASELVAALLRIGQRLLQDPARAGDEDAPTGSRRVGGWSARSH